MGRHAVNVFSDRTDFLPSLMRDGSFIPFIPEWRCDTKIASSAPSLIYRSAKNPRLKFSLNRKTCVLQGPIANFRDGQTIAYVAYALLEKERQINGEVTIHAAAASYKNKGVLLLGERSAGKTSVLLNLCRNYRHKIVGNDLTLLKFNGKFITIQGGTKIFGLRHFAAKINHPDLLKYFPQRVKDSWSTKVFLHPEALDVESEKRRPRVSKVFFLHLDSTGKEPIHYENMSGQWIKIFLHENLSRYIRGSALTLFLDKKHLKHIGFLPSLDEPKLHKRRTALINYLVDTLKIKFISGSNVDKLSELIHSSMI